MRAAITVVGSLNMDFVVQVERLPRPGETVLGGRFAMQPGGKGANQACAAAKLGGRARMVGRVGDDGFGVELRRGLESDGVDTRGVHVSAALPSGVALIFVEASGQNQIVVAAGANQTLTRADVDEALAGASEGYLLLQLESPLETIEHAAALGARRGLGVVLDPAPARPLPDTLLANVSCLTPNESEAMALLGQPESAVSIADAPGVARALLERGPRAVILKLGAQGAYADDGSGGRHFPAPRVDAVDATAAGDTFNGAFAVALAERRTFADAVAFANAAAALSVTRHGAQASIPSRSEVDAARW
jgi:ribokinase